MSTRGLYGIRKKGMDKLTYNHSDSYPDGLGRDIVEFCKKNSIQDLNRLYDLIELIDKENSPTDKQREICKRSGYADFSVSSCSDSDWYCLLRNLQGNIEGWQKAIDNNQYIFMSDDSDFIKDSLFCEYAYIINLDKYVLEFYVGFQKNPDKNNRYGCEICNGYYPCKCVAKIGLNNIDRNSVDSIINYMREIGENDDYEEEISYEE